MSKIKLLALATLASLLCTLGPVLAAGRNEERVRRLSAVERRQLDRMATFSARSLDEMAEAMAPDRIEKMTREILALDNLSVGSRSVDDQDRSPIHHYLLEHVRRLEGNGLEYVGSLKGVLAAPVSLDRLIQHPKGPPARATIGDRQWLMAPLWPNGVMPSLCPEGGLTGPLVYVAAAEWSDLRGLALEKCIAVMDFEGSRNWERVLSLGAQAVIVVEDNHINREKAEGLFCNTPIPCPRFFVDRKTGDELISLARRKQYTTASEYEVIDGSQCHIEGGNIYENRPWESIFAYLPPTPPLQYTVSDRDLLERIALEYGVTVTGLMSLNKLSSPSLTEGLSLLIPGQPVRYKVARNDLLGRLASEYALRSDDILKANPGIDASLPGGTALTIPNVEDSVFIIVPIDSVSVAPDAPHGAKIAANIAVALSAMEHIATASNIVRRKGIVFGFLDAESNSGMTSRTLAEYAMLSRGQLGGKFIVDPVTIIERYRRCVEWAESLEGELSSDDARWLDETWLRTRLGKVRIAVAENRIEIIKAQQALPKDQQYTSPEGLEIKARLDRADERIRWIVDIRSQTLENKHLSHTERARAFLTMLAEQENTPLVQEIGISVGELRTRLKAELMEEADRHSVTENNLALAGALMNRLHHGRGLSENRSAVGWWLDMVWATPSLKVSKGKTARTELPGAGNVDKLENRYTNVFSYASTLAGWTEEWALVTDLDQAEYATRQLQDLPVHADFWPAVGAAIIPLITVNDDRMLLDTPRDMPEHANFDYLSTQARTALFLSRLALESPVDSLPPERMRMPKMGRLIGEILQSNIRSGIDAQDPVPGSYVYWPATKKEELDAQNTLAHVGSRRGVIRISLLNGSYVLPVENVDWFTKDTKQKVYCYHLDRAAAVFDKIADKAQIGSIKQKPDFKLIDQTDVEKDIVMTDVYPLVLFPGPNPSDYAAIGGKKGGDYSQVIDAVRDGDPQHWGYDSPGIEYGEEDVDANILYMPPGRRARMMVRKNITYKLLLPGEVSERRPKGEGIYVGPLPGDRNVTLPLTPLFVARQMYDLAVLREKQYREHGIRDTQVEEALARSREKLAAADAALEEKDWQAAIGAARESWGILIKNYPRILRLGREAVFSAVLLMALLAPASSFLEKLVIGRKSIIGRLIATTVIFVLGVVFLNYFHPAFVISVSPFIVMIAFTMILMSSIVLTISYQRFEVLLRRARAAGGEVEGEEISLLSSLSTALALGVSNLKKRPSRTFLTVFTVTVLTFSIITFVSVKGKDEIDTRQIMLDTDVLGRQVEARLPEYSGLLFREYFWGDVSKTLVSAVRCEFGKNHDIALRAWYLQQEGGNNMDREGVNQVAIRFGKKRTIVTGVMCFEPNEVNFSGLNKAVSNDQWFLPEDRSAGRSADRDTIIIPDNAAAELGITADMVCTADGKRRSDEELPVVSMLNKYWRVVGILDTDEANTIRDINGKSMAMVDYARSAFSKSAAGGAELASEPPSYHLCWTQLAIVPIAAMADVNAKYRSVAVKFPDAFDAESFYSDLALRINKTTFGTRDGKLSLITTKSRSSVGGLAKIVVPVILCILIVLNTMLANVEERKGEVGMLGAIGLSPSQISFLLLSESGVFSVLGIVFGTFGGLLFANGVEMIHRYHNPDFLAGLSLNFTSLTSMGLAMGTGLVVLLATLIPARKAAALAAPSGMARWALPEPADNRIRFDLPFTLTRGNAVGMMAFFRRFLLNHTDAASSGFNCRNIRITVESNGDQALATRAHMWLAPYDLDVAQDMEMKVVPTENEGVFGVKLVLHRTSGTEEAWIRTNYGFMDLVRHQFLLWRNLENQSRMDYITEGANLFQEARA